MSKALREYRRAVRAAAMARAAGELPPIRFRWDRARCTTCGKDFPLTVIAPGDGDESERRPAAPPIPKVATGSQRTGADSRERLETFPSGSAEPAP